MSEKTVEEVVAKWLVLKSVSISMYIGNVNEFINIINGVGDSGVREQYYPNKDIQFFKDVLDRLGESYE